MLPDFPKSNPYFVTRGADLSVIHRERVYQSDPHDHLSLVCQLSALIHPDKKGGNLASGSVTLLSGSGKKFRVFLGGKKASDVAIFCNCSRLDSIDSQKRKVFRRATKLLFRAIGAPIRRAEYLDDREFFRIYTEVRGDNDAGPHSEGQLFEFIQLNVGQICSQLRLIAEDVEKVAGVIVDIHTTTEICRGGGARGANCPEQMRTSANVLGKIFQSALSHYRWELPEIVSVLVRVSCSNTRKKSTIEGVEVSKVLQTTTQIPDLQSLIRRRRILYGKIPAADAITKLELLAEYNKRTFDEGLREVLHGIGHHTLPNTSKRIRTDRLNSFWKKWCASLDCIADQGVSDGNFSLLNIATLIADGHPLTSIYLGGTLLQTIFAWLDYSVSYELLTTYHEIAALLCLSLAANFTDKRRLAPNNINIMNLMVSSQKVKVDLDGVESASAQMLKEAIDQIWLGMLENDVFIDPPVAKKNAKEAFSDKSISRVRLGIIEFLPEWVEVLKRYCAYLQLHQLPELTQYQQILRTFEEWLASS